MIRFDEATEKLMEEDRKRQHARRSASSLLEALRLLHQDIREGEWRGRLTFREMDEVLDRMPIEQVAEDALNLAILTTARMLIRANISLDLLIVEAEQRSTGNEWHELPSQAEIVASRIERIHQHLVGLLTAQARIKHLNGMCEPESS